MKNEQILACIINVFRECDIHSFPFDCLKPFRHYGYKVFSYEQLRSKSAELYDFCISYSEDAFRDGNSKIVAYNSSNSNTGRVRFSLMHELGHVVLDHIGESDHLEYEANYFASNILAPRMAIHYAGCKNANDVAKIFDLSYEASEYAFDDYRRWHRRAVYHMTALDWQMYRHFWNPECKMFAYSINRCFDCDKIIYNKPDIQRCPNCEYRHRMTHVKTYRDYFEEDYDDTKSMWYH